MAFAGSVIASLLSCKASIERRARVFNANSVSGATITQTRPGGGGGRARNTCLFRPPARVEIRVGCLAHFDQVQRELILLQTHNITLHRSTATWAETAKKTPIGAALPTITAGIAVIGDRDFREITLQAGQVVFFSAILDRTRQRPASA